jgi:radical SAM protein with 4Fe4S-binding SPASM domain
MHMVKLETPELLIGQFQEQHYSTVFNPRTGFFARVEEPGYTEPFWSWHGPELLDIAITNWCDRGCAICYRNSSLTGKHMSLNDYERIMRQASCLHVFQVALGGGNPNQHPDFCEILRLTRKRYAIVPSYTTNGRGLTHEVLRASAEYCGAVAVSAYAPYEEMKLAVRALRTYGIKTNIHFVLDSRSIGTATAWLESPPAFLDHVNAIVFLNYKPVGRRVNHSSLLKYSDQVSSFFELATSCKHKFKVGFDSCLVSGLVRFTKVPAICYDGCEAGRFSMFISETMKMYPCSFMEVGYQGIPVENDNMPRVWRTNKLFVQVRDRLATGGCQGCKSATLCLGGCPVFGEINLCLKHGDNCQRTLSTVDAEHSHENVAR